MYPQFSHLGSTTILPLTTSTAEAVLAGVGRGVTVVRVFNSSNAVTHFKFNVGGGQTATTADNFIAPQVTELFSVGAEVTHVAALTTSGTGNLYVIRGGGQ